jgi:hypothetical protein
MAIIDPKETDKRQFDFTDRIPPDGILSDRILPEAILSDIILYDRQLLKWYLFTGGIDGTPYGPTQYPHFHILPNP